METATTALGTVDETARRQFEAAWRQGQPAPIEQFLPAEDHPNYLATLEELVHIELELAWKSSPPQSAGATPDKPAPQRVEAYLARFARLNQPSIVLRLLGQEYRVRQQYGDHPSSHEYRERFPDLVATGQEVANSLLGSAGAAEELPQIPGYEILGLLGRGGMGVVYKARHVSLNRIVALKMISAGAGAGPEECARFRTEAEAVARLQHPNIVQIYEVGQHQGRPYFALEFVDGGTLAQKVAGKPQPARAAAEWVEILARAIHGAHLRHIVHRDLKPANVLLSADGILKITDFGLAKRLDSDASQTTTGALMGTPSYMAPEQTLGKTKEIGPATAAHAQGVILDERLTGRPPVHGETVLDTLAQLRIQDPVPPSRLRPKLARDLETICLKCLQKESPMRYASAEALADDLRRFLAGEAIHARATSAWERGVKWARRRPALAALLGVSGLSVLTVLAVVLGSNVRLKQERDATEWARQQADLNFSLARDAVDQMLTRVGQESLAQMPHMERLRRDLLEQALRFYQEFVKQKSTDPTVRMELGRAYWRLGEIHRLLKQLDQAEEPHRQAVAVYQKLTEEFPTVLDYGNALGISYANLGNLLKDLGRFPEAEQNLHQAISLQKKLLTEVPTQPYYHKHLADTYNTLGILLWHRRQVSEAEQAYRQALALLEPLAGDSAPLEFWRRLAMTHNNLGYLLARTDRLPEAEHNYRQALAVQEKLTAHSPQDPAYRQDLAGSHQNLGDLLHTTRPQEAEQAFRQALDIMQQLADDFPARPDYRDQLAQIQVALAHLLRHTNRLSEAEQPLRQALVLYKKLATDFPTASIYRSHLAELQTQLGELLQRTQRLPEAEQAYRQALAFFEKLAADTPGERNHRLNLIALHKKLGDLLAASGRGQPAEQAYRQAVLFQEKLITDYPDVPNYHLDLADTLRDLATLVYRRKELPAASQWLRQAIAHQQTARQLRPDNKELRQALCQNWGYLTSILVRLGDHGATAEASEEFFQVFPESAQNCYVAACFLAACVPLAENDGTLPSEKRQAAAQSYADRAMNRLREAIRQGFKDAEQLSQNAELDSLRSRDDFKKLLAEVAMP